MSHFEVPTAEDDKCDLGILNRNAFRLNQEAAETLSYQVIPCGAENSDPCPTLDNNA